MKLIKMMIFAACLVNASTSFADFRSCPLVSSDLENLRAASQRLAKSIKLSAHCQAQQELLNQSNLGLSDTIAKIQAVDPNVNVTSQSSMAMRELADQAVVHLNTINTLFKDPQCGHEMGVGDYVNAFADTAVGLAPFLAIHGGDAAGPWVLGTALAGTVVKTLVAIFRGNGVNMRDPDQSNMFIKNSCAFYTLNQVKSSIEEVRSDQKSAIQAELDSANRRLAELDRQSTSVPREAPALDLHQAMDDKSKVTTLLGVLSGDELEACSYISRFSKNDDGNVSKMGLVQRIIARYKITQSSKISADDLAWDMDYFNKELNAPFIAGIDQSKCGAQAKRWINKMISYASAGLEELQARASGASPTGNLNALELEKSKQRLLIASIQGRMKFIKHVDDVGFNIAFSEIQQNHESIQNVIFRTPRSLFKLSTGGLAEEWLTVKQQDAQHDLGEFGQRLNTINVQTSHILEVILGRKPTASDRLTRTAITSFADAYKKARGVEHPEVNKGLAADMCSSLRKTRSTWTSSLVYAQAGFDYCRAFSDVIDRLDFPEVQRKCFGTTRTDGKNDAASLKNLVTIIKAQRPNFDAVSARMRDLNCAPAAELTPDAITTAAGI